MKRSSASPVRGRDAVGLLVQQVHDAGRGHQGAVGAGAEPAAAPERSDSEPRRDGQGLRRARSRRVQGHRRRALAAARREVARGNHPGRQPADLRPRPPARGRRELSATSRPTSSSCACRTNSRARRTGSRPSACATTSGCSDYNTQRPPVPVATSPPRCSASRNTRTGRCRPRPGRCRR